VTAAAPAPLAANPFASAVIGLPGLIGSVIAGPQDPISGFFGSAALPEGTNIPGAFGLRSRKALAGPSGPPLSNPFEAVGGPIGNRLRFPIPGFQSFFNTFETLPALAQRALSFVPEVAQRAERAIQATLDAPIISGASGLRSRPFQAVFEALGGPAVQVSTEQARRRQAVASARTQSAEQVSTNPFFLAVADAARQGRLPGAVASPAAVEAFGTPDPTAFAPLPQLLAPTAPAVDSVRTSILARLAALESPPAAVATRAVPSPIQEVSTVATVPTTGLGGFFGGLADVIQASTPLLGAILPPLISRGQPGPIFLGGGPALPAGQIPGVFADPRIAQATAAGALLPTLGGIGAGILGGALGDFFGGGGAGANCIVPQVGTTLRLPSRIDVPSPSSKPGALRFVTYKNMGAPVLFRGDLAACKRVRRVGRMVKKVAGGR